MLHKCLWLLFTVVKPKRQMAGAARWVLQCLGNASPSDSYSRKFHVHPVTPLTAVPTGFSRESTQTPERWTGGASPCAVSELLAHCSCPSRDGSGGSRAFFPVIPSCALVTPPPGPILSLCRAQQWPSVLLFVCASAGLDSP